MGRDRKPLYQKIAEGNPGKQKLDKLIPNPSKNEPRRPRWLSKPAKTVWARLAPTAMRAGTLTELSAEAFGELCQAEARKAKLERLLQNEGTTYKTTTPQGDSMHRPRPEFAQLQDCLKQLRALRKDFRFTATDALYAPDDDDDGILDPFPPRRRPFQPRIRPGTEAYEAAERLASAKAEEEAESEYFGDRD